MSILKVWVVMASLALLLALGVACTSGSSEATPTTSPGSVGGVPVVTPSSGVGIGALPPTGSEDVRVGSQGVSVSPYAPGFQQGFGYESSGAYYSGVQQSGIWVSGTGRVTVKPDLALLTLGVEVRATTVGEAISKASASMNGVLKVLKDQGVQDKDIQTTYFNIQPIYTSREVFDLGGKYWEQVLLGYQVTNQVSVKIRDLNKVGQIIDEAAKAGGDTTRVQGISFTVEDTTPYQNKAREAAVLDAVAKAKQFSSLTGVILGKLVYIAESGGAVPIPYQYNVKAIAAEGASSFPTPISGGELEIQVSIQAVFAID